MVNHNQQDEVTFRVHEVGHGTLSEHERFSLPNGGTTVFTPESVRSVCGSGTRVHCTSVSAASQSNGLHGYGPAAAYGVDGGKPSGGTVTIRRERAPTVKRLLEGGVGGGTRVTESGIPSKRPLLSVGRFNSISDNMIVSIPSLSSPQVPSACSNPLLRTALSVDEILNQVRLNRPHPPSTRDEPSTVGGKIEHLVGQQGVQTLHNYTNLLGQPLPSPALFNLPHVGVTEESSVAPPTIKNKMTEDILAWLRAANAAKAESPNDVRPQSVSNYDEWSPDEPIGTTVSRQSELNVNGSRPTQAHSTVSALSIPPPRGGIVVGSPPLIPPPRQYLFIPPRAPPPVQVTGSNHVTMPLRAPASQVTVSNIVNQQPLNPLSNPVTVSNRMNVRLSNPTSQVTGLNPMALQLRNPANQSSGSNHMKFQLCSPVNQVTGTNPMTLQLRNPANQLTGTNHMNLQLCESANRVTESSPLSLMHLRESASHVNVANHFIQQLRDPAASATVKSDSLASVQLVNNGNPPLPSINCVLPNGQTIYILCQAEQPSPPQRMQQISALANLAGTANISGLLNFTVNNALQAPRLIYNSTTGQILNINPTLSQTTLLGPPLSNQTSLGSNRPVSRQIPLVISNQLMLSNQINPTCIATNQPNQVLVHNQSNQVHLRNQPDQVVLANQSNHVLISNQRNPVLMANNQLLVSNRPPAQTLFVSNQQNQLLLSNLISNQSSNFIATPPANVSQNQFFCFSPPPPQISASVPIITISPSSVQELTFLIPGNRHAVLNNPPSPVQRTELRSSSVSQMALLNSLNSLTRIAAANPSIPDIRLSNPSTPSKIVNVTQNIAACRTVGRTVATPVIRPRNVANHNNSIRRFLPTYAGHTANMYTKEDIARMTASLIAGAATPRALTQTTNDHRQILPPPSANTLLSSASVRQSVTNLISPVNFNASSNIIPSPSRSVRSTIGSLLIERGASDSLERWVSDSIERRASDSMSSSSRCATSSSAELITGTQQNHSLMRTLLIGGDGVTNRPLTTSDICNSLPNVASNSSTGDTIAQPVSCVMPSNVQNHGPGAATLLAVTHNGDK